MASATRLTNTGQDDLSLMDNSISGLHRRCFEDFELVISLLEVPNHLYQQNISSRDVSNEFDRYKLWCSNVGAAHDGPNYRMSLDYRLREAPSYKDQIGEILVRLAQTLERTGSLLEGSSQPFESKSLWDDETDLSSDAESSLSSGKDDSSSKAEHEPVSAETQDDDDFRRRIASIRDTIAMKSEAEDTQSAALRPIIDSQSLHELQSPILEIPQLIETIQFTVTCLYRIPVRRPATLERSSKLATIKIGHFEPFDNAYIDDRCPAASTTLKQRLQRMTSRRRRLLLYRAQHYEHIKVDLPRHVPEESRKTTTLNPTTEVKQLEVRPARSEKESSKPSQFSKATTFNPVDFPQFSTNLLSTDQISETDSLPSTNPSLWTGNQKLYIPPRPKGLVGGKHFLCPYCFVLCQVKSDKAWKRHVLKDLEPYICTFANCALEDHQFDDRNDWYEHELQKHRFEWSCNLGGHSPCTSPSEFLTHLQDHHPGLQSSSLSHDAIRQFQRPAQRSTKICPFCSKPSEKLKTHLSRHMEQIALYVLGGNNQEDTEHGSDASDKARRVDSSADFGSDEDDFDGKPPEIAASDPLQEDILEEQVVVPDTNEGPWTIPFDISGCLILTATLIKFSNFASRLVFPRLVFPDSIPLSLTGVQPLYDNDGGFRLVLSTLLAHMKARNTMGCLTPIERNLDVVNAEAMKLCRDLELQATVITRDHPSQDSETQENLEHFLLATTPRRLWDLRTQIDEFRSKLLRDILLPISDALNASDYMLSSSILISENIAAAKMTFHLKKYNAGSLLASLPEEALRLPEGGSPDDESRDSKHPSSLVEYKADDTSQTAPEDDSLQARAIQDAIISSLKFSTMMDRYEHLVEASPKTFEWIFQPQSFESRPPSSNFVEWLRNGDGFYWIYGKAGSGKSTLLKFICDHHNTKEVLRQGSPQGRPMIASFFIWAPGTSQQRSTEGLLRTILHDLLRQAPDKVTHVFPLLWRDLRINNERQAGSAMPQGKLESSEGSESARHLDTSRILWSRAELQEALLRLFPMLDNVCLFVDGLDEFNDDHEDLIHLLKSLLAQRVKICVTSRPWLIFENHFGGGALLRLQDLTYHDIKLYVHQTLYESARMVQLSQSNSTEASDLVESIVQRAEGVFLWVFLVVRSLLMGLARYDSIRDLLRRLEVIPVGLENLYSHMMRSIDPVYMSRGSKILLMCRRADQLEVGICAVGLSLSHHLDGDSERPIAQDPYTRLSAPETIERVRRIGRTLESRCGGLLELATSGGAYVPLTKEGNLEVKYTHRTVADFLQTRETMETLHKGAGPDFNPDVALLGCFISRIRRCFHPALRNVPDLEPEYTLWAYLVNKAMELARDIELETGVSETAMVDELAVTISHQNGKPPLDNCPTFLEFATVHSLALFLNNKLSQNSKHRNNSRLLLLALCDPWKRRVPDQATVALLLQRGVDPNAHFGAASVWQHYLNIFVGNDGDADFGHLKILRLLIEHGANPLERGLKARGSHSTLVEASELIKDAFSESLEKQQLQDYLDGQKPRPGSSIVSSDRLLSGLKWTRKAFSRRKE